MTTRIYVNFFISFLLVEDDVAKISELFRNLVFFKPTKFWIRDLHLYKNKQKIFFDVMSDPQLLKKHRSFTAEPSRLGGHFTFLNYYPDTNIVTINGGIEIADIKDLSQILEPLTDYLTRNNILSASVRLADEYMFNDRIDLDNVRSKHPELKSVKTIGTPPYADPEQFPAHTHNIDGIWFGCCYEMWFGSDYDKYIPLEKLRSFNQCKLNETLENGTVHIVLYDSPDDFASEKSVANAWAFRKHTECDKEADFWEAQVRELSKGLGQQVYEIEEGKFPHGGIRLIKTYLDENGKHVPKHEAVKVHISEREHDGKAVFEKIDDL